MRVFLRTAWILMGLSWVVGVFQACAWFQRMSGPRWDIAKLIRKAATIDVPDEGGMETARFTRPDLRPALRRVCMRWPLAANRINSSFGQRFGKNHHGLDLRARVGTPVHAVLPGWVIYSGTAVRGYGRLILVKHPRGLTTVYAHNSEVFVEEGRKVQAGELIAFSGDTGETTGPHLHFEVRDGESPLDPLEFLPGAAELRTTDPCGSGQEPSRSGGSVPENKRA